MFSKLTSLMKEDVSGDEMVVVLKDQEIIKLESEYYAPDIFNIFNRWVKVCRIFTLKVPGLTLCSAIWMDQMHQSLFCSSLLELLSIIHDMLFS